jgi:hypothetical protein
MTSRRAFFVLSISLMTVNLQASWNPFSLESKLEGKWMVNEHFKVKILNGKIVLESGNVFATYEVFKDNKIRFKLTQPRNDGTRVDIILKVEFGGEKNSAMTWSRQAGDSVVPIYNFVKVP